MSAMTADIDRWFEHKVAIVTGASLGIGYGVASALVDAGVSVMVVGRSQARMDEAAHRLSGGGDAAVGQEADVSDPEDVKRMVDSVVARFGRLDFLVNSAGVRAFSLVHEMPPEQWEDVINVQLTGTFLACQAAIDPLIESGGRIVNMSSMFGYKGRPAGSSYAAAKSGVVGLTKVLASELAPRVTVNAIAPGAIETERLGAGLSDEEKSKLRAQRGAEVPMKRPGIPADIAWATMYLLGPGAGWVTGQVLHVNGGALMP
ncbi:MAG: SDR family NAD(P)-dependent oxidoreductase [Chloroflexota bacterium]